MMTKQQQKGMTLIELMISIALGMAVISMVIVVYIGTVTNNVTTLKTTKLNQELSTLMGVMVNDIRRAGYSFGLTPTDPTANIFNVFGTTSLTVIKNVDNPSTIIPLGPIALGDTNGECILYTYDRSNNGAAEASEFFGFRLFKGAVQMRISGSNTINCNLNADVWTTVTSSDIVITALQFDRQSSACINTAEPNLMDDDVDGDIDEADEFNCHVTAPSASDLTVDTQEVKITLNGHLADDNNVALTLESSVRVRNDLVRKRI